MESKDEQQQQHEDASISVLNGDEFHNIHKILARESSVGQSSRVYYRSCNFEGVPFRWEMQPGTPLNNPQQDVIPPLSPPPLIQGLGLPLPNMSSIEDNLKARTYLRRSKYKIKGLKKIMVKSSENLSKKVDTLVNKRRNKGKAVTRSSKTLGEYISDEGSSLSSLVSYNSSSSLALDSLRLPRDSIDGPFCCSPWNLIAILDEENTRIYYCRHHKTAFALEEDGGSFLSRILSRVSSCRDQLSGPLHKDLTTTHDQGVPFKWEKQPGTPKSIPPEDDEVIIIPPPTPPPAVQSLALPRPNIEDDGVKESRWKLIRAFFWKRKRDKTKMRDHETSFRYNEDVEKMMKSSYERDDDGVYLSCGAKARFLFMLGRS